MSVLLGMDNPELVKMLQVDQEGEGGRQRRRQRKLMGGGYEKWKVVCSLVLLGISSPFG